MFGFFWKKKKKDTPRHVAPGTEISYDPDLVAELKADHQDLLGLFGKISNAYEAKDYDSIPAMLSEFGTLLRGHLLKENIKLYIYLQHAFAEDSENSSLMQDFRSEMNGISKSVTAFLNLYSVESWDEHREASFGMELESIGKVLVKRIKTEESTLYPLYMSPDAYQ